MAVRSRQVELAPTREPMDLPGPAATKAHGLLINAPRLTYIVKEVLHFTTPELSIAVRSFDHTAELIGGQATAHALPAITHHLVAESNGIPFDGQTLLKELARLSSFLGFVKGMRVGLGHLEAENEGTSPGLRVLGFTKSDRLKAPTNWYFASISKELPTLFQSYLQVMRSDSGRRNFGRAMHYYNASNTAFADSTEIALIISMARLEASAFHVLRDRGGWSVDLLKRATLADMLRATSRLLSIDEDPIIHAPPLVAWRSAASRSDFDGFNVLAEFRNGLTHPILNFTYDGPKLLHAWFASQWLLEVLMLVYLGYRGIPGSSQAAWRMGRDYGRYAVERSRWRLKRRTHLKRPALWPHRKASRVRQRGRLFVGRNAAGFRQRPFRRFRPT